MSAVTVRALATHEARKRRERYAAERQERMRGYEIEWAHAEALRDQAARAVVIRCTWPPFRTRAA